MPSVGLIGATVVLAAVGASAIAQSKLPPVTRTVFKCQVDGKTTYLDNPCVKCQDVLA